MSKAKANEVLLTLVVKSAHDKNRSFPTNALFDKKVNSLSAKSSLFVGQISYKNPHFPSYSVSHVHPYVVVVPFTTSAPVSEGEINNAPPFVLEVEEEEVISQESMQRVVES
ncbi:uncharacterized protein MONOS_13397 [Monocercomonoides exilis]|uniref:uncharacterized protein n=1 Tax=Monocercomonoides exilis TaxID=2049356 RepID=UPI00355A8A87|nr:hypothetical protein MONOS_13397 [Monocercomonoides exilis]|eukprot:MONOS_13397.1-p1 / transcript=MONOS_13397.1 / gene=MONOS_13397 / organism=Monocercomonoides_exilis_PA203 / gene_product=unspecified product / transcript_product=unspecified product / location=Mono_scaffold00821:22009-22344(+) / protein_length=112 / sequence_SO=supercontig / SO=protein_coding / is_pseudo=false